MADISARLKLRQGTAAQWASVNPVLQEGEPGYETDTGVIRVGDGASTFTSLKQHEPAGDLQPKDDGLTDLINIPSDVTRKIPIAVGVKQWDVLETSLYFEGLFDSANAADVITRIGAVDKETAQTITGIKTFSAPIRGEIENVAMADLITLDLAASNRFEMTLDRDLTIDTPSNIPATTGQTVLIILRQDNTGSRLVSWGAGWLFPLGAAPLLSMTPGAIDIVVGEVISETEIMCNFVTDFS